MKLLGTIIVSMLLICSCSTQDSKIKDGLRSSIPVERKQGYEFKEFTIIETILDVNIKDSINKYLGDIKVNEELIKYDSLRLKPILSNIEECEENRANTIYYLRSTYDGLIRDYNKMCDEILQDIQEKENMNKTYRIKIDKLKHLLETVNTPIVYYKIKHIYNLDGMRKEEIVTLDFNYKYINF